MASNKGSEIEVSLIDNKELVLQATDRQIEMALIAIGAKMESHAKADYVPVDTGRLKNSITFAGLYCGQYGRRDYFRIWSPLAKTRG